LFEMLFIKPRDADQVAELVGIAGEHLPFVREFIPSNTFCDSSLQRALHGVSGQIICAIEQLKPQ
jgi:hypothetical protein